MSDFKSKLPDFKELASMTSKLFKGIKDSVEEIVHDYKQKRKAPETKKPAAAKAPEPSKSSERAKPTKAADSDKKSKD